MKTLEKEAIPQRVEDLYALLKDSGLSAREVCIKSGVNYESWNSMKYREIISPAMLSKMEDTALSLARKRARSILSHINRRQLQSTASNVLNN